MNIQEKNQIREKTEMLVIKADPDTDIVTFSSRLQEKDHKLILYVSPINRSPHNNTTRRRLLESQAEKILFGLCW